MSAPCTGESGSTVGELRRPQAGCGRGPGRSPPRRAPARPGWSGTGDSVALDAGPAAYALARALPETSPGRSITHSMPVLHLLAERAGEPAGPRLVVAGW